MDEIKWELIHIITDPLPPEAPAPTLSFLHSAGKPPVFTYPALPGSASFARVNAGIFLMQQGRRFTSNTPAPGSCPAPTNPTPCPSKGPAQLQRSRPRRRSWASLVHARRHGKGNGADATGALDTQISAWDFPVVIFLVLSIIRPQSSEELLASVGGIAGEATEQATRHRCCSQSSASAPGAWQKLLGEC